jgi:hypothetical protein
MIVLIIKFTITDLFFFFFLSIEKNICLTDKNVINYKKKKLNTFDNE